MKRGERSLQWSLVHLDDEKVIEAPVQCVAETCPGGDSVLCSGKWEGTPLSLRQALGGYMAQEASVIPGQEGERPHVWTWDSWRWGFPGHSRSLGCRHPEPASNTSLEVQWELS